MLACSASLKLKESGREAQRSGQGSENKWYTLWFSLKIWPQSGYYSIKKTSVTAHLMLSSDSILWVPAFH